MSTPGLGAGEDVGLGAGLDAGEDVGPRMPEQPGVEDPPGHGGVGPPPGQGSIAAPLRRTLALVRPVTGRLALATLLGAGAVAAGIGLMGSAAWLIARASQRPQETALAFAIVIVQACGLSRGFFRYGERLVGHDAAFRLLAALRVRIYRALEVQAPVGLIDFRRGDLLARLVGDVDALQDLVLGVLPPFVIAVGLGAATVAIIWWMLPGAGLALLVCLLAAATVVPWLGARLARRSEARQAALRGELTAAMVDLVEGAAELTVYGATATQVDKVARTDAALADTSTKSANTAGVGIGLTTLCAGLATWIGLVLGVPAVHAGRLDPVLLAVIALVPLAAFELVAGLPAAVQALQRARYAASRIFQVLDAPPVVEEPGVATTAVPTAPPTAPPAPADQPTAAPPTPPPTPGRLAPAVGQFTAPSDGLALSLRDVYARYPGAGRNALCGVHLDLLAGTRIAVVGPSGSGKSTLAAVLLRFLPYQGSVRLGPAELADRTGDDVRRTIGLVTQDAYLFDTTVAENLRVGWRGASDEELWHVLERVRLADWAHALPDGLATDVGTRGGRLSGGQRQRIALARALLADFPVLVLDEPAEHLDQEAANALTADLLAVTGRRSTLLITHQLTGLHAVDRVMVVADGRVLEEGDHHQLVAGHGWYAERWRQETAAKRGSAP